MGYKFPSADWFETVRTNFNVANEHQRGPGSYCDCLVGVKVGADIYLLEFEGRECVEAAKKTENDLNEVDFYLDMPLTDWQAMVENIQEHGHATGNFTLNTIDLNRENGLATSVHGDQYREDMFFRFNQTLQNFFDASHQLATEF